MIYSLSLGHAFLIAGALLLVLGAFALAKPAGTQEWLRAFPRSRAWGITLLIAAALWAWYLVATIDLGEFDKWRGLVLWLVPVAAVLTIIYVQEFLAARALGMLLLLAAEPPLEAAFLQPELSRLFLVTFVYVGIVAGMFWIGMPYVLRDQVQWLGRSRSRLLGAGGLFAAYGALLLILGLTVHPSA